MKHEIKVPKMGESVSEATVSALLKEGGAFVEMDEEVLELETDKVNQVLFAPESGVISFDVKVGDVVKIGQVIGLIDQKDKKPSQDSIRVQKEQFIEEVKEKKTPEVKTELPSEKESRKPMSTMRKVIAGKMLEAQSTTAMLTTFNEVDLSEVVALRKKYQEDFVKLYGVKLGLMSFFVKASVAALKAIPSVNSYIEGDEIVTRNTFDLGVAVGTDLGVIVPVIRGCDALTFAEIELLIGDFAKKARGKELKADDLQGGGFTITNGGIYGSLLSTPILNPPQSGILGMHKIQSRPVVVDQEIVIRPMMYLALTYDHRIIDGKEAVTFLVKIKDLLEDPARLMIGV